MKIDHYDNDPKQSPTAQSLIQGEINALVTFWPDIRDDEAIGPEVAFDLLAIWAHLRRFDATSLDESLVSSLNDLIAVDTNAIIDSALRFEFPVDWPEVADRIDEAWDQVTEDDEIDNLEDAVSEHFEVLDRGTLVAYSIEKLQPARNDNNRFANLVDLLHRAEDFLGDNPDVFLPAAALASAMLDSYRFDIHEFDPELWETTLKHQRLQALIDEREASRSTHAIDGRWLKIAVGHLAGRVDPTKPEDNSLKSEQPVLNASVSPEQIPAYVERVKEVRTAYFPDAANLILSATPDERSGIPNAGRWQLTPNIDASVEVRVLFDSGSDTLEIGVIAALDVRRQFELAEISFGQTTVSIPLTLGKGSCKNCDIGNLGSVVLIANDVRYQPWEEIAF